MIPQSGSTEWAKVHEAAKTQLVFMGKIVVLASLLPAVRTVFYASSGNAMTRVLFEEIDSLDKPGITRRTVQPRHVVSCFNGTYQGSIRERVNLDIEDLSEGFYKGPHHMTVRDERRESRPRPRNHPILRSDNDTVVEILKAAVTTIESYILSDPDNSELLDVIVSRIKALLAQTREADSLRHIRPQDLLKITAAKQ